MDIDKIKNYFWLTITLFIAAAFINVVFFVMPAIKKWSGSFYPSRVLSVSAEGRTFAIPDIAATSFSVVSEGQNPSTIADENNRKISRAIELVKSQGIEPKDIKTSGYNLSPRYEYDEDRRTSFISGYTLRQTVSLKIRNFDKIAPILAGLPPLGINEIGGLNFTVDEPEKFLAEARSQGFKKAQAKARNIAKESGVRLGRIISVGEAGGFPPIFLRGEKGGFGGDVSAIEPPTIEPGEEELTVQVSITYALE